MNQGSLLYVTAMTLTKPNVSIIVFQFQASEFTSVWVIHSSSKEFTFR